MSFSDGLQKRAFVTGALIGAAAGGEKDEHGHIVNRGIGALRGGAAHLGANIGGAAGAGAITLLKERMTRLHGAKRKAAAIALLSTVPVGVVAGGHAGYHIAKRLGHKYKHEEKK